MVYAVWLTFGFMGMYKQFKGISKPKVEVFIDDIIHDGI